MNGYIGNIPIAGPFTWLKLSGAAMYLPSSGYSITVHYFGAFVGGSTANLLYGATGYSESNFLSIHPPILVVEENSITYWACEYSGTPKTTWIAFKQSSAFYFDRIEILCYSTVAFKNATLYGSNNSTNGIDGDWTPLITGIDSTSGKAEYFYLPGGIKTTEIKKNYTYHPHIISNPSFEKVTSNKPDGWALTQSNITAGNFFDSGTTWKTDGDKSFYMGVEYGSACPSSYYVMITQKINFIDSTTFVFDAKTGALNGQYGGVSSLLIDNSTVWSSTAASTEYLNQSIDVSAINTAVDVQFKVSCGGVSAGDKYAQLYIDNIRINDTRVRPGKVLSLPDHYFSRRYP